MKVALVLAWCGLMASCSRDAEEAREPEGMDAGAADTGAADDGVAEEDAADASWLLDAGDGDADADVAAALDADAPHDGNVDPVDGGDAASEPDLETCPSGAICRAEQPSFEALNQSGSFGFATFVLPSTANSGGATVYYPTSATPPFAYVIYCPPYTYTQSAFQAWGPYFASHGIVLGTMDSVTTYDPVARRALGLEELMAALKAQNSKAGSPLEGKLDESRGGVLGWSMGGGAILVKSSAHPEWKSAVLFATHTRTASGWEASASQSTIPTLLVNGATDTSGLGGMGQSEGAYAAIPATTPKLLYVYEKLGHFDWGSPAAGGSVGRYAMAWEKTFLEGDTRYRAFLSIPGPGASTFQSSSLQ